MDRCADKGAGRAGGAVAGPGRTLPPAGPALTAKAEPDTTTAAAAEESLYLDARMAKRRLMFHNLPDLAGLETVIFCQIDIPISRRTNPRRHPELAILISG